MYGRQAFMRLLEDEGVTHLFGNPGTTELPIMQAVPDFPGVQFVLGLQEGVVLAMADGFARASRKLTAACVHVAPGLGNGMGALFNAKFSGSPVIVTAGQQEQGHGLLEPLLYEPLTPMAAPLVKWAVEVSRAEDLPRIMRRAAKIALTPPTGPVFISLPGDILNAQAEIELGQGVRVETRTRPTDEALRDVVRLLVRAKRPALIAGQEIASRDAFDEVERLAEMLGAAVFQESIPYAASFRSAHPLYTGMLTRSQKQVRATLEPYDLVVCVGADLLRMSVYSPVDPLPSNLPVVHLSERPWELGKNYRTDVAIAANVKETLKAMLPLLEAGLDADYRSACAARRAVVEADNWSVRRSKAAEAATKQAHARPIDPAFMTMSLVDNLPEDAIVVEEALTSSVTLPQFLRQREGSRLFGLASGGLGFAVPGAVGISLAKPDRPVVALVGDGSAMYGIQGLWTAAHLKRPITYVIANNRSYRIIKERLIAMQGADRFVGMDLREPDIDFCALGASFGLATTRIEHPADIAAAIRDATASGRTSLIDISVADGFGT